MLTPVNHSVSFSNIFIFWRLLQHYQCTNVISTRPETSVVCFNFGVYSFLSYVTGTHTQVNAVLNETRVQCSPVHFPIWKLLAGTFQILGLPWFPDSDNAKLVKEVLRSRQ